MACNFNCRIETEGFFKVASSHVHCKSDNISEIVQERDRDIAAIDHCSRKWYVAYRIAPFSMTLSDLQRHLPIANLFNCDFCTFLQQLTTFQLAQCVCGGPSEIAELLLRYNSVAFKSHSRLPLFYHIVSISTILFIFGSFGFRLHRTSIICWWYCTTGL